MATPGQIKKIHALKGALKLDDDTYRQILGGSGVKSSKDRAFTILIADELIDDLERKAIAAGVWEKRKPAQKAFPSPKRGEAGRGGVKLDQGNRGVYEPADKGRPGNRPGTGY